jgi:hypothetical protein
VSVIVTVAGQSGPSIVATNGDTVAVTVSPAGATGPQGVQGATGPANTLTIGTVTSGTAAATITGTAPSQTLNLVLPVGSTGATGSKGDTGSQGPAGPANSLSIGTVTSGTAAATITGTAPNQTLNLVLQKGDTGAQGPAGATGPAANLADETPQPLGVASAGTALSAARADHVHAVGSITYSALSGIPSTFAPSAHTHAVSDVTGLQTALDGKQAAGTYATLVNGLVPSSALPSFVDDVVDVGGTLPSTGDVGKIYVVSTGTNVNKIYRWSGSTFIEISPSPGSTDSVTEGSTNLYYTNTRAAAASPVQSVAGRTGTVTLAKADVGLGSVDNTADTAKPISTATQTALDGKAATSHTHSLANLTQSSATTGQVPTWNGTAWAAATPSGGGSSYTLPTATSSVLGGVKVGSGLTITDGVLARSSSYDPAAAPGAPSGIVYGGVTVSWNPSPGGVATYYEVQYVASGGSTYSTISGNVSGTSIGFSGTVGNQFFRVRGYNADNLPGAWGYQEGAPGGSSGGGGSDSRWDLFLPPAPTSVTATAGNGQALLSWTAPTGVIAQAPITDYVLQYSSNSGSTWTTFSDGTSTATSATVTGLTNGTAYTFRVAAVNGVGTGAYSAASSAVTPSGGVSVSYLVVAGGGGGGVYRGGGGGAGGYLASSAVTVTPGASYAVVVGAGGPGGTDANRYGSQYSGSTSSFGDIASATGGGGGAGPYGASATGGSGGGGAAAYSSSATQAAGSSGTSGQGNAGGNGGQNDGDVGGGGGGGGAGAAGQAAYDLPGVGAFGGGNGGNGLQWLDGNYYAGGGGGSGMNFYRYMDYSSGDPDGVLVTLNNVATGGLGGGGYGWGGGGPSGGVDYAPATGGAQNSGGGGGGFTDPYWRVGGGSGVVIIRTTATAASTTGSPTVTQSGGYNFYKFTGSGSITF